jgi:hypothetical protein
MIILKQGVQEQEKEKEKEKEKMEPNQQSEKQVKKVIGMHYKIN